MHSAWLSRLRHTSTPAAVILGGVSQRRQREDQFEALPDVVAKEQAMTDQSESALDAELEFLIAKHRKAGNTATLRFLLSHKALKTQLAEAEQRELLATQARIRAAARIRELEAREKEAAYLLQYTEFHTVDMVLNGHLAKARMVFLSRATAQRTDSYGTPLPPISESDGAIYGATAQQPETWRHKEKGGVYVIVDRHAKMKIDSAWLPAVVYRDANGHHYTRVAAAFDRNFERIAQQPAEGKGNG